MLRAIGRGALGKGPAYCLVCRRSAPAFLPYRSGSHLLSPVLRDLGLVGSDLDRFRCPWCGSTDRERHLLAYLNRVCSVQFRQKKILHFAPEQSLRRHILGEAPLEYIQADLFPSEPDITEIDITAIPFGDGHFDVVIANHVLEHVDRDAKALQEISRVLKFGGHAILQTPFAALLPTTLEIAQVRSPEARQQLYGQEDHVRLYGADIIARFEANGLTAMVSNHTDVLADLDATRYGINESEPLLLFQKRK